MRAKLVRIGNSRGIRLPKPLIEQAGLADEVELEARDGAIVISPADGARVGWEEAARVLHESGDDHIDDREIASKFDEEEWEW